MSLVECPCCHSETESRQLSSCPGCGEYACADCLKNGGGLCPDCAAHEPEGSLHGKR